MTLHVKIRWLCTFEHSNSFA